jgi:hypothetical protein
MTRGDLVFALEHLQFERWNSTVAIRIDRGVARAAGGKDCPRVGVLTPNLD